MKPFHFLLVFCIIAGCKKAEQKVQENLLVTFMTDGQWKVSNYVIGNIDSTSAFQTYKFQFKSNNTVDAFNNGILENTGNWSGDINTRTISSNFTNPSSSLRLLNGSWLITNSSPIFVEATNTANGEVRKLRLDKI